MRGRHPIPNEAKEANGNPGEHALDPVLEIGELYEPGNEPPPPASFKDAEARDEWEKLCAILTPVGLLRSSDLHALECLCDAIVLRRSLRNILRRGLTETGSQGQRVRNAIMGDERAYAGEIRKWCERFGLDPSSRTRISNGESARVGGGGEDGGDEPFGHLTPVSGGG